MIPPYGQQSQRSLLHVWDVSMFAHRTSQEEVKTKEKGGLSISSYIPPIFRVLNFQDKRHWVMMKCKKTKTWQTAFSSPPQGGSLTPNEADPTVGIYGWPLTFKVHIKPHQTDTFSERGWLPMWWYTFIIYPVRSLTKNCFKNNNCLFGICTGRYIYIYICVYTHT